MVSKIRRALTVQERAAAFEDMSGITMEAAEEERRHREKKTERPQGLRLAGAADASKR
ncbi:hypothetical protein [Rhizobium sp. BK376]|uniref:hypothetical protein n=1 Tax=Rhizobium sp. BK376 TaxID=2512149 RepID=UPI0010E84AEB|nr:hypothetical protein [Rhizobium sp. BK376]TCR76767.1 hypothetical protein EV561_11927 [Rhizobium sp. BK376]